MPNFVGFGKCQVPCRYLTFAYTLAKYLTPWRCLILTSDPKLVSNALKYLFRK
jgi:hypothetical protein